MLRTWPLLLGTMLGLAALTIGMGQGGSDFAKACHLAGYGNDLRRKLRFRAFSETSPRTITQSTV